MIPGSQGRWYGRALSEALLLYRFAAVGLLAGVVHIGVAGTLVATGTLPPLSANLVAFSVAFALSFTGQYFWTFRCTRHWMVAVVRFAAISATAFGVNNLLLLGLLQLEVLPAASAAVLAPLVIPIVTYLGNRFWALA